MTIPAAERLAIDRTRLAFERTMMAWVRTASSMITFGFTIYKFFQLDRPGASAGSQRLIGAREFALMLVVVGLTSLALAALQQRQNLQALRADFPDASIPTSQAGTLAILMSVLGIVVLFAVVFRQ